MLQIGSLQRSGEFQIVVEHESAPMLAPSALGKRDPIPRCELRELRIEPPTQDFRTLLEVAWDRELFDIPFDPHPALRLHDRTNVVEDDTSDSRRPPYRQHHSEEARRRCRGIWPARSRARSG